MLAKNTKRSKLIVWLIAGLIILTAIGLISYNFYAFSGTNQAIEQQKKLKTSRDLAVKAAAVREAKRKEPVYINLPGATPVRALVEDYTVPSSIWAIVNKTHPIPIDYVPPQLVIPDVPTLVSKSDLERSIRSDIETPMKNMFAAASAAGYQLMINSGYRSAALQATYFNSLTASVGEDAANQAIARPGQSEHQTGLAADISTVSQDCYLSDCFANTPDGQWLANNSYRFGFILRFPQGKESITGYEYEPWHFRYVGIDLATAIYKSELTFDEVWPYLQKADATLKQNGAI
jgi:D-alanyl-D-alanine carboxypeptidase